ncbi:DUF7619 domain-containing protein [Kordia sp.]|uniref:T9SS type A sorting domain-containing protein n=1 Tax=Kordia sp. TaxID=1965332 RepID=UPI003B5A46DA
MKKNYLLLVMFLCTIFSQAQNIYIPDPNFKQALISTYCVDFDGNGLPESDVDTNNDGEIQVSEALAIQGLRLDNQSIASLEGIGHFTNLVSFSCSNNPLTELVLTQNTNLRFFTCNNESGTLLTNIDISQNINLEGMTIIGNLGLTSIDISQNPNLKRVRIGSCNISNLDISQNSILHTLELFDNPITSLDFSQNPNLKNLHLYGNSLTNIDVTPITGLEYLRVFDNPLPNLDLSQNINLENLNIGQNSVSSIDLSQNVNLEILIANEVGLTSLDISQNPLLRYLNCNLNNLTTLDFSQNPNLEYVECYENQLTTLDISANPNLEIFRCQENMLTSINVGANPNLRILSCGNNLLTSLDVTGSTGLTGLSCTYNDLTELDLSQNSQLLGVSCYNNSLRILDVSQNPLLDNIKCMYNELEEIYIRNGVNSLSYEFGYYGNPNLRYVCVDDGEFDMVSGSANLPDGAVVSTYCPFTPGEAYHNVSGNTALDTNLDGCDVNDGGYPNLTYNINDGTTNGVTIANTSGDYIINFSSPGIHTITPEIENPDYFLIAPTILTVDTATDPNPTIQDFCVTPNGTKNDLDVTIIPLEIARPGFDARYQILYRNKGNTILSGAVQLTFDDAIMDLVNTSPNSDMQTTNVLTWNYIGLAPFETRSIIFTMNINAPTEVPAVNGGDILSFEAVITPVIADETPDDNVMNLQQVVLNSYDPNDIRCLEGEKVTTDYIDTYVHYLIRFENTGTASAVNVAVRDIIDQTKFDISTLRPVTSSHQMVTNINNGNEVEFLFENINLPFDDANNDGYLVFKIKTLASLQEGDTFENVANIFFDFNFPIVTNTATTLIANPLSVAEGNLSTDNLTIYPNPTTDLLYIKTKEALTAIEIRTLDGRLVQYEMVETNNNSYEINLSFLASGMYIVNTTTKSRKTISKIFKE